MTAVQRLLLTSPDLGLNQLAKWEERYRPHLGQHLRISWLMPLNRRGGRCRDTAHGVEPQDSVDRTPSLGLARLGAPNRALCLAHMKLIKASEAG
jgi:hypothetical protein